MPTRHIYGWRRDKVDTRDLKLKLSGKPINLPSSVDLRTETKLPNIYDQGKLGSCTANAIGFAYQYDEIFQKNNMCFTPSRLYIYYNERVIEGTINEDSGAEIRDGIKSINSQGVCDEMMWPYQIEQFATKPTELCYQEGKKCTSVSYTRVNQDLSSLKTVLYQKRPFVFGFTVYESFESDIVAKTGMMPIPDRAHEQELGGHAVACVGYDDHKGKGCFIVRNSWGSDWGDNGYFYMPYQIMVDSTMASDFWIINQVTNPTSP